jgi:hypothetical protein
MSTQVLPPNPCLAAIILGIKTPTGSYLIFHYPPNPGSDAPPLKLDYANEPEEESSASSDDDTYSSLEDDRGEDGHASARLNGDDKGIGESESASPEKSLHRPWARSSGGKHSLLGLPLGLHHLILPPRSAHKKRFEMTIDGLVFLGWPVFSREDGDWKRRKRREKKKANSAQDPLESRLEPPVRPQVYDPSRRTSAQIGYDLGFTSADESAVEDYSSSSLTGATEALESLQTLHEEQERKDPDMPNPVEVLNMFHVVFVLNPPLLEYQSRVDDIYNHVVKKFSRALKWEQIKSKYVLKEAEKLRSLVSKRGTSIYLTWWQAV